MDSVADAFSSSYAEARVKFRAAAEAAGLDVEAHVHPLRGRDGEELAMDVVREVCSATSALRKAASLRNRLPLASLTVVVADPSALAGFESIVAVSRLSGAFSAGLSAGWSAGLSLTGGLGAADRSETYTATGRRTMIWAISHWRFSSPAAA